VRRLICVIVLASSLSVVNAQTGDNMNVVADPKAKFDQFKTFSIGTNSIESVRFELNNRLFVKLVEDAIRGMLVGRGMKEIPDHPDLVITFNVKTGEVFTSGRGVARGQGPQPVRFTEANLVIDLTRPGETAPVWRGTFADKEDIGSKLVEKLPEDARKLLGKLPR